MAGFRGTGDTLEAQRLIQIGSENSALFSAGYHSGCQEEALEQSGHQPQIGTYFLTKSGSRQPVCTAADTCFCAANIAANRSQTAAGVFDQGTHYHVCPHIRGLYGFHELSITVIHHTDNIRFYFFAEGNQLANLPDRKGGSGGIAFGALNGDDLGFIMDCFFNPRIVKGTIRKQIHLPISYTVLRQRAGAGPNADNLLQGVIGEPHRA